MRLAVAAAVAAAVSEFCLTYEPLTQCATMPWLEASGYVLTEATGGTGEGNGSVGLVFTGQHEVAITLDCGQRSSQVTGRS